MNKQIAVIKGDGIGPEIVDEAIKILDKLCEKTGFSLNFEYKYVEMGGCAIDKYGIPLPDETIKICKASDSVLLGSVGGPKWDTLPGHLRPEAGLLGIRKALGLYANLRPAVLHRELADACPLKKEIVKDGFDIMVIRELTGGIYFGERGYIGEENTSEYAAFDTEKYSVMEIERIVRLAFDIALKRKKKVISIDKANVLETSRLWRCVFEKTAKQYPEVEISNMLVDNAAMQLVRNPGQFDTVVVSNMFGDILTDEAAMITGSIGLLPSASLGENSFGLYEPMHGSAPDIAGMDIANPIATILSAAMMLRYSFGLADPAEMIENAVAKTLADGYRTADIKGSGEKINVVGTAKMGDVIAKNL